MTTTVRGDRGRIGFLLPADGLTDDEYWSCLPDGVALLAARYLVAGGLTLEELESDTETGPILDAVELIRQAQADVAALADCAGAVVGGLEYERDLVDRVEARLGGPATSTPRAIAAALHALGARRIVLAAPYLDVVVERFAEFLAGFGIETIESRAIAFAAETEIADLGPERWRAIAGEADRPEADAVVLGGGGIRAAAELEAIERDLGKPVVAAPAALVWHASRLAGADATRSGLGRLFSECGASPAGPAESGPQGRDMTRRHVFSGGAWEEIAGYARAVVDGEWIFVSGTTGYDYATGRISDDPVEQTRQCFRNLSWALGEAGATLEDVVRVVAYVADPESFPDIAKVFGEHFRDVRPANTTVVCRLVSPEMKIEIEVTARRRAA